jgi:hypothetical protein
MEVSHELSSWWGRQVFVAGRADLWQIGSLNVQVERSGRAWHFAHDYVSWSESLRQGRLSSTPHGQWPKARRISGAPSLLQSAEAPPHRSVLTSRPTLRSRPISAIAEGFDLIFQPSLLERTYVASLLSPISLAPEEKLSLAVKVPLSLRIDGTTGTGALRPLFEVPLEDVQDTWHGPEPREGELAWACPSDRENLERFPSQLSERMSDLNSGLGHVIVAVEIRNSGPLRILEHFPIPSPQLSLFHATKTGFWTDRLSLEWTAFGQWHKRPERQPPKECGSHQLVAHPRSEASEPAIKALRGLMNHNMFRER